MSSSAPLIEATFDQDDQGRAVFVISSAARKSVEAHFVYGHRYTLERYEHGQRARDRAYHAELRSKYDSLPEDYALAFPTYDDFRAHALIKTGYFKRRFVTFDSPELARKNLSIIAALMAHQQHAIVLAVDNVVEIVQPESQKCSHNEDMDREKLHQSYKDVLDFADAFLKDAHGKA